MAVPSRVGRYTITGEIGRGSMGAVLAAHDPALDRAVAVKIIASEGRAGSAPDEELIARFLREAKLAARINHPGVVTVHDAGQHGDTLYLVMELVEGESLKDRLDRGDFPSRAEAFRLVADVAEALAAAHSIGVVHRDIKPGNILLTRDGRVKVGDFGVAKGVGDSTELTRAGATVGSPSYMAPEQLRGGDVDGRADLFSLGVVLYELLMRRRPFPADTISKLIYQILNHDPLTDEDTLISLGPDSAGFLQRCLAKHPTHRVADATTFASAARELAMRQPVDVRTAVPTMTPEAGTLIAPEALEHATLPDLPAVAVPTPPPLPPDATVARSGTTAASRQSTLTIAWIVVALATVLTGTVGLMLWKVIGPGRDGGTVAVMAPSPSPTSAGTSAQVTPPPAAGGAGVEARAIDPPPSATAREMAPLPARTVATRVRRAATPISRPATATPEATPEPLPTRRPTAAPTPTPPIVEEFNCREGADFDVDPEEAEVAIDGVVIGIADQWDGSRGGKIYMFPGPGTYYARFSLAPRYETAWIKLVVSPDAERRICKVDTELEKSKKKRE